MLFSDQNLSTTGGNNAPAELLLCGEGLHPGEVTAKCSYCLMEHRVEWTTGHRLLSLQGFELWDYLPLNNCQN